MHFEVLCPLKAVGREGWEDDSSLRAGFNTLSLTSVFKQSVEACKPPDQWKIARVSAAFKKKGERKIEHVTDHCLCSVYQVN